MQLNNVPTYDQESIKVLAYPSAKIAGALVLATMALLGVTPVGGTIAGFFNHEGTVANAFQAGTWETAPPPKAAASDVTQDAPLELTLSSVEVVNTPPQEDTPPLGESAAEPTVTLGEVHLVDPPAEAPPPAETQPPPEAPVTE
jgi:hypothetical protein